MGTRMMTQSVRSCTDCDMFSAEMEMKYFQMKKEGRICFI